MEYKKRLISTKQLDETQIKLFDSRLDVQDFDFIKITILEIPKNVNPFKKNVLITSQNAVRALSASFQKNDFDSANIYCVGEKTKKYIEKTFGQVTYVENSAKSLANYLIANEIEKEITFFCGSNRRDELPSILKKNGFLVREIKVYQTQLQPISILTDFDGVLFFSPSAVQSFIQKNKAKQSVAFCVGQTTANEATKHFSTVLTPSTPSVENVIDLVNAYYEKNEPKNV